MLFAAIGSVNSRNIYYTVLSASTTCNTWYPSSFSFGNTGNSNSYSGTVPNVGVFMIIQKKQKNKKTKKQKQKQKKKIKK